MSALERVDVALRDGTLAVIHHRPGLKMEDASALLGLLLDVLQVAESKCNWYEPETCDLCGARAAVERYVNEHLPEEP